jgi:uncharacterized small protein (DUF1192 family)
LRALFLLARIAGPEAKPETKEEAEADMAMEPDEPRKKVPAIVPGEDISTLSVHELEQRIAALESEIVRARDAIRARDATKSAADAFFKR